MRQKIVNDRWLIEETTALDEPVIRPSGQIDAPEG